MKWINHEREARVKDSLTIDRQPVIYWATNHLLARIYSDSNTLEASVPFRCFLFSAITSKEIPPRILTVIEAFTCIS